MSPNFYGTMIPGVIMGISAALVGLGLIIALWRAMTGKQVADGIWIIVGMGGVLLIFNDVINQGPITQAFKDMVVKLIGQIGQ